MLSRISNYGTDRFAVRIKLHKVRNHPVLIDNDSPPGIATGMTNTELGGIIRLNAGHIMSESIPNNSRTLTWRSGAARIVLSRLSG